MRNSDSIECGISTNHHQVRTPTLVVDCNEIISVSFHLAVLASIEY